MSRRSASSTPWMKSFIGLDPADAWRRVEVPVLAVNGTLDLQVWHDLNLDAIHAAVTAGGGRIDVVRLEELNHMLQPTSTGLPRNTAPSTSPCTSRPRCISDWILRIPPLASAASRIADVLELSRGREQEFDGFGLDREDLPPIEAGPGIRVFSSTIPSSTSNSRSGRQGDVPHAAGRAPARDELPGHRVGGRVLPIRSGPDTTTRDGEYRMLHEDATEVVVHRLPPRAAASSTSTSATPGRSPGTTSDGSSRTRRWPRSTGSSLPTASSGS